MELSDWVDGARTFTEQEMDKCATRGECARCGLCCVAFADYLPIQVPDSPDAFVTLFKKEAFQVCPHLTTNEGLSHCTAQAVKKQHPSLKHCDDWRGNGQFDPESDPELTHFDVIVHNFWTWVLVECEAGDLNRANKLVKKGFIQWCPPIEIELEHLEAFLHKLIEVSHFPTELVALMHLDRLINTLSHKRQRILKRRLGLTSKNLNSAQRSLLKLFALEA